MIHISSHIIITTNIYIYIFIFHIIPSIKKYFTLYIYIYTYIYIYIHIVYIFIDILLHPYHFLLIQADEQQLLSDASLLCVASGLAASFCVPGRSCHGKPAENRRKMVVSWHFMGKSLENNGEWWLFMGFHRKTIGKP